MVESGDFARLNQFSDHLADEVTSYHSLTLPQAFGVHSLVSLHATVNSLDAFGDAVPHKDDRTSYFLTQFASHLAAKLPAETFQTIPHPHKLANSFNKRNQHLAHVSGQSHDWLKVKLAVFAGRVLRWMQLTGDIAQEPVVPDDVEALQRRNRALLKKARHSQRPVQEASVYEAADGTWTFLGPSYNHVQAHVVEERTSPVTPAVRPNAWPTAVMAAVRRHHAAQAGSDTVVFLGQTGEVYGDQYQAMPLGHAYETAGKAANYETLRQFLLERYISLRA